MTTSTNDSRVNDANDAAELAQTGPGTIAGRYFRRFWLPVAEVRDVEPGRAKAIQVLGQQFTFYRGVTGDAHLVDYFCAHRSSPLFTGHVEGDCIRCFYHGWMYDADGQCVEQPAEDAAFAAKVHEHYRTPYVTTIIAGIVMMALAGVLPIEIGRASCRERVC